MHQARQETQSARLGEQERIGKLFRRRHRHVIRSLSHPPRLEDLEALDKEDEDENEDEEGVRPTERRFSVEHKVVVDHTGDCQDSG